VNRQRASRSQSVAGAPRLARLVLGGATWLLIGAILSQTGMVWIAIDSTAEEV
jgi:hypothetical protein